MLSGSTSNAVASSSIVAYYQMSQERLDALTRACQVSEVDGGFPLNRGICEDAAYSARLQELIAAKGKAGGPFPAH